MRGRHSPGSDPTGNYLPPSYSTGGPLGLSTQSLRLHSVPSGRSLGPMITLDVKQNITLTITISVIWYWEYVTSLWPEWTLFRPLECFDCPSTSSVRSHRSRQNSPVRATLCPEAHNRVPSPRQEDGGLVLTFKSCHSGWRIEIFNTDG